MCGDHKMAIEQPQHLPFKAFPSGDRDPLEGLPSKLKYDGEYRATYKFVGDYDQTKLANKATDFIVTRSDGKHETILNEMERFLSTAAQDCIETTAPADRSNATQMCWFSIKIGSPDKSSKQPRWHQDGMMFPREGVENLHAKYAFTLLGPSTRVVLATPEQNELWETADRTFKAENREMFESVERGDKGAFETWFKKKEPFMAERLQGVEEVKIEPRQIIRWVCGEGFPVHSEPDSSEAERIYVNMFFGTEDEMKNNYLGEEIGEKTVDIREDQGSE